MEQAFQAFLNEWQPMLLNPQKRLFWGYLLSALVIALLWLKFFRGLRFKQCLRAVFVRESWLSASARADYLLGLINSMLMPVLASRLIGKTAIAYFIFELLHDLLGGRPLFQAHPFVIAVSFTLFLFLFDDFARYLVHRLLHQIPILWSFHKVHHSATALNPVTVLRAHPVEGILFSLRSALVQGICIAVFFFFFGDQVTLIMVLGAGLFNFTFNILGSNLRHSPIPIGYWKPLERVLMSPGQHHIHHSTATEHIDRNFGVALSLWDYCFGTFCYSEPDRQLTFGLKQTVSKPHSLLQLYWGPFAELISKLPIPRFMETVK
ncbi:MAG: sterol desaturase family protein [Pseudomonadota bacterium]